MFKSIILAIALSSLSSFASASVFSKVSPRQQKANFHACVESDESWMRRWGRYVIGFELASSYDLCRKNAWPNFKVYAKATGCFIEGHWRAAGYFCESP